MRYATLLKNTGKENIMLSLSPRCKKDDQGDVKTAGQEFCLSTKFHADKNADVPKNTHSISIFNLKTVKKLIHFILLFSNIVYFGVQS
jgi:hypothetical protein